MEKTILSILVSNQPGVLHRVSGMFLRRGYNIDNLTVSTTVDPQVSRITAVVTADDAVVDQMIRQVEKLYDVQGVRRLSLQDSIRSELALVKLRNDGRSRQIVDAVKHFHGAVVDLSAHSITAEIIGSQEEIDDFLAQAMPFGILEMARTGLVALERGDATLQ
ncbi:MAG: acetolactate synthase small subunit [Eubacteriales bacterium]|nr:acetolactate synthase small subunit [Eubacteriales bacterium]